MALDIKDLLHELDLPAELAEKEIADVKTAFHETFVSRKLAGSDPDIVTAITGKVLGSISTVAAREFGLAKDEVTGKKVEEIISLGASKFKTNIEELTKNQPTDVKEWETKLEKERKEALKFKEMAEGNAKMVEDLTNKYNGEIKSMKVETKLAKVRENVPISAEAKPLEIEGFNSILKKNYVFDFEEGSDTLMAFDSKGEKIPNDKKTGFLTAEDVLKIEAQKNGILKLAGNLQPKKTEPPKFRETETNTRQFSKAYERNKAKYGHS